MKIMQIIPEFGLAGAETMCENLTYELIKQGHTVIVVSLYNYHSSITQRLEEAGVDVRYLNKKPGLDFTMFTKFGNLFRTEKPDVIHTHRYVMQYTVPATIIEGIKRRVHTVHSIAEKENKKHGRLLNKFFFKICHIIPVALSELIRDSIVGEYKIKKEKVPVVFNGIDLSKCMSKEDYSINGNFKILHIGRFAEPKNHMGLLKAFNLFHDQYSDSELWLIGDGEKKEEIEKYVIDNGLEKCVKFLGLQSDVYGYLRDADIFALPSIYEGIPMTLIEAMGTGLPIVATSVGGIPDMLDQNSAILTNVEVEDIAKGFEMYYKNEFLRKKHGTRAKMTSNAFSSVEMAKKYCQVYSIL